MANTIKRKRYKVKPRFFVCLMLVIFSASVVFSSVKTFMPTHIPNFYGWSAQDVTSFVSKNRQLAVTYELRYSYDVLQNCVIGQEMVTSDENKTELIVYVSKGYPLMEDFTNKPVEEFQSFADLVGLTVETHLETAQSTDQIGSQSIPWGATLLKNSKVEVTVIK